MGLLDVPMNLDAGLYVPKGVRTRHLHGMHVLFAENFKAPVLGYWNDGVGSASRDTDIWAPGGTPSMRLDTQGNSNGGATSPGRTAATSGVVVKRRLIDGFTGRFGLECWFRLTSLNLTTNTFISMSIYNRDGTYAWHSRLWLDPNGNNQPMLGKILDGAATNAANGGSPLTGTTAVYTTVTTSVTQYGGGTHIYDPSASSGRGDKAGGWHYASLVVDTNLQKYVSVKLDGQAPVDCSAYNFDQTESTGAAMMHFSFEFSRSTSTRGYMNIGAVRGFGD